jgi:glycosyltransferase involved in cell wall biosynthesis
MKPIHDFRKNIKSAYQDFLISQKTRFPEDEVLRVDLHCHDHNSSEPDELWGRILRLPETWLTTQGLITCLKNHGSDVVTITNHNNALSCWELLDKGYDIITGAEFTCTFPELEIKVHVLIYGFTKEQEQELIKRRKDIYNFLGYAKQQGLPTVLPHPLYFDCADIARSHIMLEKCLLIFERFEVLNGQRDVWQNLMTVEWLKNCTPEMIDELGKKHGINPFDYCTTPYDKCFIGGSDDHMGTFAGTCGTFLHVPDLKNKTSRFKLSELALDALKEKRTAPFGYTIDEEKLNIAILDYFTQAAKNLKDPGLLRLLLHRGNTTDKLFCFAISNILLEIQRHKFTTRFFDTFHNALLGKRPGMFVKHTVHRDYKDAVLKLDSLAVSKNTSPSAFLEEIRKIIPDVFEFISSLLIRRIKNNMRENNSWSEINNKSIEELIDVLEVPTQLRMHFTENAKASSKHMTQLNVSKLFDTLSFPALTSLVIAGSYLGSTYAICRNRHLLESLSKSLDRHAHPKRLLWLTDTFSDKNGISSFLQSVRVEAESKGYAIDFVVCSNNIHPQSNLHVIKPLAEVSLQQFGGHLIGIPNILDLHSIFQKGGYDRIICSTELVMGLAAMCLKEAFCVPAYFYMHTDWLDFFQKSTDINSHAIDRIRRMLRAFYKRFDGVFVLNSEHKEWLASSYMELDKDKIFMTSHWLDKGFHTSQTIQNGFHNKLLFAGRLSKEKGVMDLPMIVNKVNEVYPEAQIIIAGAGPAEQELKTLMPHADFRGWVGHNDMPSLYAEVDMLLLPSKFDTFGVVVLEAMRCSVPVAAYNSKGPRDIITNGVNGYLSNTVDEMALQIISFFESPHKRLELKRAAQSRSMDFQPDIIMKKMLEDLNLIPN